MLILTRLENEQIFINQGKIKIKVISIRKGLVALGIQAPSHIDIEREEIFIRKKNNPLPNKKTSKQYKANI